MSFIRSDEHSAPHSPDDPLYYAPRAVRSEAAHRSNATQTRSDHLPPTSSRSRFDEMREEAFAKSNRHPLELQFAQERRPRRALFAVAGGVAAAIGVAVVVALIFFNLVPKLERDRSELAVSISTPALATPAQTTPKDSQELLHGFMQFQQSQESNSPERAVSEPASAGTAKAPEKSEALLEKFIQWEQRK
ncbi:MULTISPECIES: hypothetical protein [unclassified Bradyrhizobium]|uniref:hypothetical protein n=1 Tax=unclassified Bradyrhizobium TaxID=2631580 RepID=UPI002FEE747C